MAEKLFEKYCSMSEEEIKGETIDLVRNKLQRQFEVAYDDAFDKKMKNEEIQKNLCIDMFEGFDINVYLDAQEDIDICAEVMKDIEDLHVKFFDTDIRGKR